MPAGGLRIGSPTHDHRSAKEAGDEGGVAEPADDDLVAIRTAVVHPAGRNRAPIRSGDAATISPDTSLAGSAAPFSRDGEDGGHQRCPNARETDPGQVEAIA